jgi:hypothetical protein
MHQTLHVVRQLARSALRERSNAPSHPIHDLYRRGARLRRPRLSRQLEIPVPEAASSPSPLPQLTSEAIVAKAQQIATERAALDAELAGATGEQAARIRDRTLLAERIAIVVDQQKSLLPARDTASNERLAAAEALRTLGVAVEMDGRRRRRTPGADAAWVRLRNALRAAPQQR